MRRSAKYGNSHTFGKIVAHVFGFTLTLLLLVTIMNALVQ